MKLQSKRMIIILLSVVIVLQNSFTSYALEDNITEEEVVEVVEIPEAENIGTSLGALFRNIKL